MSERNLITFATIRSFRLLLFVGLLIRKSVSRLVDQVRRHRRNGRNRPLKHLIERLVNENPSHRVAAVHGVIDQAHVRQPNVRHLTSLPFFFFGKVLKMGFPLQKTKAKTMKFTRARIAYRRNGIIARTRTHRAANLQKNLRTDATIDRSTVDRIPVRVVILGIEIVQEIDRDHCDVTIVTGKNSGG